MHLLVFFLYINMQSKLCSLPHLHNTGTYTGVTGATAAASCSSCVPGKYSLIGAEVCTVCAVGMYQGSSSKNECIDCAVRSFC